MEKNTNVVDDTLPPDVEEFLSSPDTLPSDGHVRAMAGARFRFFTNGWRDAPEYQFSTGTQVLRALKRFWEEECEQGEEGTKLLDEFIRRFAEYERRV